MNTKYNVGQEISTVVEAAETICGIKVNTKGAVMYNMKSGKAYTEEALSKIVVEDKPKEEPRFKVGEKAKIIANTSKHGFDIDDIVIASSNLRLLPKGYCWKCTDKNGLGHYNPNVYECDLEPYTEPEQKEPIARLYCVESGVGFAQGKIYEQSGGKIVDGDGAPRPIDFDVSSYWLKDNHLVPLISRPAKVDEWIIPISGDGHGAELNVPCKVTLEAPSGRGAYVSANDLLWHSQYLVLDGYQPKEPFKPYLECDGKNYGIIGEKTEITAFAETPLYVGDVVETTKNNGYDISTSIVINPTYSGEPNGAGVMGFHQSSKNMKNGIVNICGTLQYVRKIRDYTELKDGETINNVTVRLNEKGE